MKLEWAPDGTPTVCSPTIRNEVTPGQRDEDRLKRMSQFNHDELSYQVNGGAQIVRQVFEKWAEKHMKGDTQSSEENEYHPSDGTSFYDKLVNMVSDKLPLIHQDIQLSCKDPNEVGINTDFHIHPKGATGRIWVQNLTRKQAVRASHIRPLN
jgi:hypothetical protein